MEVRGTAWTIRRRTRSRRSLRSSRRGNPGFLEKGRHRVRRYRACDVTPGGCVLVRAERWQRALDEWERGPTSSWKLLRLVRYRTRDLARRSETEPEEGKPARQVYGISAAFGRRG